MWVNIVRQIRLFLKKWFWEKPTEEVPQKKSDTEIKAKEVMHDWDIITYNGTKIPFRKHEIPLFNALSRKEKRVIAIKMKAEQKKGRVIIVEIDGKDTIVLNHDYETRARKNSR